MRKHNKKGFRRGEVKRAPKELTARIAEENAAHPVTVRKLTPEELFALREKKGHCSE